MSSKRHHTYSATFSEGVDVSISEILDSYSQSGSILQRGRNTLKQVSFLGEEWVVKAFRIPGFPQDLTYGTFAKSKAEKAYVNAQRLLQLGFHTPKPIGFIENKEGAKLKDSYYICEYLANRQTLADVWKNDPEAAQKMMPELVQMISDMHDKGIIHRDLNPNNLLIPAETSLSETFSFSMVDINRITWEEKPLALEQRIGNLSRLFHNNKDYKEQTVRCYAEIAGADLDKCEQYLEKAAKKTAAYFRTKKKIRRIFPKKNK
ncbi:MAG: lipopolysaccharide kinase InaA family protein [Rhizobiaceae bacterium]